MTIEKHAEKHVNYFALEKACEKEGCPVCTIISDRVERYIDGMLFEHVSDRTFRAQFRTAGGFCSMHSRNLDSFRDGLAVAILSRDILEDALTDFKKKKMRKREAKCPVCMEKERIEREFLTFIAHEGQDAEFQRFFTASSGLCVPHYSLLVTLVCSKPFGKIPQWLSNFQETYFSRLLERVGNFIEFSAWGRQNDFKNLSEKDKIVWKEAAAALRGME